MSDSFGQSATPQTIWVKHGEVPAVEIPVANITNVGKLIEAIYRDEFFMQQLNLSMSAGLSTIKAPKNFKRPADNSMNNCFLIPNEKLPTLRPDCPISVLVKMESKFENPFKIHVLKPKQPTTTPAPATIQPDSNTNLIVQVSKLVELQRSSVQSQKKILKSIVPIAKYVDHSLIRTMFPVYSHSQARSTSVREDIRHQVHFYYGIIENENKKLPNTRFCHVSGEHVMPPNKESFVVVAHIFPRAYYKEDWVIDYQNINEPGNTLLLFKPIEAAFDTARLCFVWNREREQYEVRILDPAFKTASIRSVANQYKIELPNDPKYDKPFGDYEGKALDFSRKPENLPWRRSMQFMAFRNRNYAVERKWIEYDDLPELDDDDAISPDSKKNTRFMEMINRWRAGVSPDDFDQSVSDMQSPDEVDTIENE